MWLRHLISDRFHRLRDGPPDPQPGTGFLPPDLPSLGNRPGGPARPLDRAPAPRAVPAGTLSARVYGEDTPPEGPLGGCERVQVLR